MVQGIKSKGMDPSNFTDYLSIFKYGMPPHGGFGMGLERLTMTILGLKISEKHHCFRLIRKELQAIGSKQKSFLASENIRNEIIRLIKYHDMEFQHVIHDPTPTSEDSARARAT